jgi:type IV secretion system protein VirD4
MVAFDLKLELFRYTSLFRQRHGQEVYLWAPFAEDGRSHCWNMLDAIDRSSVFRVGDILAIAQSFYPSDCHPRKILERQCTQFVPGPSAVSHGNARGAVHARRSLSAIVRRWQAHPPAPARHTDQPPAQRRPLSAECSDAFNRFLSTLANPWATSFRALTHRCWCLPIPLSMLPPAAPISTCATFAVAA